MTATSSLSPMQLGATVAVVVGAALWCLSMALDRAPRSLAAARRQMLGIDAPVSERRGAMIVGHADGVLGRMVERQVGGGLHTIGLSVADVVTRLITSAGIVGMAVLAAVAALMAMGLLPASAMWVLLAAISALMAGWVTLHDLASRIERRRGGARRATNDFVQLVAVGLTTDQSVEEAVRFALGVGISDAFDELRDAIHVAPQRGIPLWEAIDEVGRRYDVRELSEFAASVERQGLQGVSISTTVGSLAGAMRAKALDELEREADRANANLSGPTIGFVVSTIVFLAYPLAQRISDAFGG